MPEPASPAAAVAATAYDTPPGRYDALVDGQGRPRAAWSPLLRELTGLDRDEHARRVAAARRLIRENGVTYNVYDEEGGSARPWELDLVPYVIEAREWAALEAGLIQRARLADAILADVYGPRRMQAMGLLPPHLVEGHPQFLRPLIGATPPGGVRVHLYAADLARAPDGSWVVLAERADAPAGAGYALENRIVVSQAFPELFRDQGVRRVAQFFAAFREAVLSLSPQAQPRGVLLSPGPYNEAYFEHAYLARYLGLALVEGDDLAVREGGVFLKTLAGLEPIDVIVRRVDSDFADPIEFRSDSALGVPGLAEAARAGQVVIANALGGGIIGSPGMAAVLPALCRALFGEELRLNAETALWCGHPSHRRAALAEPERYVFRDAFDTRPLFAKGSTAQFWRELDEAGRDRLVDLLHRRGAALVAQEVLPLGTAPILEEGRLAPRTAALRAFVAWTPQGYLVMPGGLTRVAPDADTRAVTMQSGGASKDTWVLGEGPVDGFSLLRPAEEPLAIRRQADEAPSRAMDNLFWLGRYAERAEELVRVLRALVRRLGDDTSLGGGTTVASLARRLLVPQAQVSEGAAAEAAAGDHSRLAGELLSAVFSRRRQAFGLQRTLTGVQRTAWAVRDRLSLDTWRSLLSFTDGEGLPRPDLESGEVPEPADAQSYLDGLVRRAAALSGLAAENTTRGRNYLFMELGRRIERAANLAWLLRQLLVTAESEETAELQLLLEIADSGMTYRYRYLGVFQAAPVIDLLLLDEANPRSVAFQVETLQAHVAQLPRSNLTQARGQDRKVVAQLLQRLANADPLRLARQDASGRRAQLAELLQLVQASTTRLSDIVTQTYFRHSTSRRAGSAPRLDALGGGVF
jgi:uncharacterized circularly permuted ATP-grasp superfamily protein/uncharacterized alpha-E superfamily protein